MQIPQQHTSNNQGFYQLNNNPTIDVPETQSFVNPVSDLFFVIENVTDEDILHEYHKCNICGAEPIWGIRFKCSSCEDVDLCE